MNLVLSLCLILLVGFTMSLPQRPGYIKGPIVYPQVLSRFNTDDDETNTESLTRLGEADEAASLAPGALADPDIVSMVSKWPKEVQPYWFINSQQIANHRGQSRPCRNCVDRGAQPEAISPFLRGSFNN